MEPVLSLGRKFLLLAGVCGAWALASRAASANEIYSLSLETDGSFNPPGDRLDIRVIVFDDVQDADLEVWAFVVDADDHEKQARVDARSKRNRDADGHFRLLAPIVKRGKAVRAPATPGAPTQDPGDDTRLSIVIPYADLGLRTGQHQLGYVVRLITDGKLADTEPAPLTLVTITEGARQEMDVATSELDAVLAETTVTGLAWLDNRLVSASWKQRMPVFEPAADDKTVRVDIPGGYHREMLAAAGDCAVASKDFVPQRRRTIYFATNRNIANPSGDAGSRFGDESVLATDEMTYGTCVVSIPIDHHTLGNVEAPGTKWVFWSEAEDADKHFLVESFDPSLKRAGFLSALAKDDIVVYVHGYNNTFKGAVLRAAQLQHDFQFSGKVIAFSWPSAGSTLLKFGNPFDGTTKAIQLAYKHDEEAAVRSKSFLAELLANLLQGGQVTSNRRVHVLAHSMGNRILLQALQELDQQSDQKNGRRKLGEVILAAADIDGSTFANCRSALFRICKHVTFYYASDDAALLLSRTLHQDKPVGLGPLFDKENMDTISADTLTSFFNKLGHLYVAESRPLLTDLRLLLT